MKKILIASAIAMAFLGCSSDTSTSTTPSVSNKAIPVKGIRQKDLTADSENLPKIEYNAPAPMPGKVKPYKKSFVTAPPMIPHSIAGMTPIKVGQNQCLMCHMPQNAKAMGITPIPKDHFVDNFEGDKVKPKIAGSRYFCTTCHTPQANLDPVVENTFEKMKAKAGIK
jgi:cytochrome c-type protein NapB